MRFAVRVTPKGGRDGADGWGIDANGRGFLKVRVAAPAAEGEANAAVIGLLAKALGRPRSALRLVSGATARLKIIQIDDLEPAEFARVFGAPPGQG